MVLSEEVFLTTSNTQLAPETTSHARPCLRFCPVYLHKFKVGSQKSVTLLWLQGRPTAEGDIFSVLHTSSDFLVFLFSSIRYFVHDLHLFLPLDLSSFLCLFNCFSFPSTTYETTTAIKPEGLPPPSPVIDN